MNKKIKVLIVDDSAVMRQLLTAILQEDPAIEVVGVAADPHIARERIKTLKPDVLTLDVEMPVMDGITFLEKLMRLHPMPVVMVSSLTEKGAASTLHALELGAVDFVTKPRTDIRGRISEIVDEIHAKVHTAARAHLRPPLLFSQPGKYRDDTAPSSLRPRKECVIVMGASAGGTQAIKEILEKLPVEIPGIAIVQHMPPRFTAYFAERLNDQCALEVREAKDQDSINPGVVLIAPGHAHMALVRGNNGYHVKVYIDELVNLHRPSVDVLFDSAAEAAGSNAMGVILTGMGTDGARGLHAMKQTGAYTIAQDKESCMIFGMPEQAIRGGGVCEISPLERIANHIKRWTELNHEVGSATDGICKQQI